MKVLFKLIACLVVCFSLLPMMILADGDSRVDGTIGTVSGAISPETTRLYRFNLGENEGLVATLRGSSGLVKECLDNAEIRFLDPTGEEKDKDVAHKHPTKDEGYLIGVEGKAEVAGTYTIEVRRRGGFASDDECQVDFPYTLEVSLHTGHVTPIIKGGLKEGNKYNDSLEFLGVHEYTVCLQRKKSFTTTILVSNDSDRTCLGDLEISILDSDRKLVADKTVGVVRSDSKPPSRRSIRYSPYKTGKYTLSLFREMKENADTKIGCSRSNYVYELAASGTYYLGLHCDPQPSTKSSCAKKAKRRCSSKSRKKQCRNRVLRRCVEKSGQ